MKILFFLAFFSSGIYLKAQTKHIVFETGNIASVLEKAKKENKLIFIDAYTSWCGPCKDMSKHVFTNDSVADYFNSRFVNYKMDMEKGEGIEFAGKYAVNCYPGFLFINGDGNLIHRGAGSMRPAAFLDFANNCFLPGNSFTAQKNKIEKEGLSENNIMSYINLMGSSCQEASEKVTGYIETVNEKDLQKRIHWILIRDFVIKYDSREIKYFLQNIHSYESKFGKDSVEEKLLELGRNYFVNYIYSPDANKTAFEKAKKDFTNLNWPHTKKIIFQTDLNYNKRFNKSKYYALAAAGYLIYNNDNASALNSMAWDFYEGATDPEQLNAAVNMAKRACGLSNEYIYMDTYASLLYKNENYQEAEKQALAAIEKAKLSRFNEDDFKETTALLKKIRAKLRSK
jgi:thioredoxin-related protein